MTISTTVYVVAFETGDFHPGYRHTRMRPVPLSSAKLYRKRGPATAAMNASKMPGRVVALVATEVPA